MSQKKLFLVWFRNDLRTHDHEPLYRALQHNFATKQQQPNKFNNHSNSWQNSESNSGTYLVPFYCFDQRQFQNLNFSMDSKKYIQFRKTGAKRANFLIESVKDLKERFEKNYGMEFVCKTGKTEDEISKLILDIKHRENIDQVHIFTSQETTQEETDIEYNLDQQLNEIASSHQLQYFLHYYFTYSMIHPDDLYHIWGIDIYSNFPHVFTQFKNKIEKSSQGYQVREPLPQPVASQFQQFLNSTQNPIATNSHKASPSLSLSAAEQYDASHNNTLIPSLMDLGFTKQECNEEAKIDERAVLQFKGGETEALNRLNHYIWGPDRHLERYKQTRNGMLGADYSSKFSIWLWCGCLSARNIYHQVREYENRIKSNQSTYWLIFELMWRDYFRFASIKYGNRMFQLRGLTDIIDFNQPKHQNKGMKKGKKQRHVFDDNDHHVYHDRHTWNRNTEKFKAWCNGQTGHPLVDANMRELNRSGYMSNRGRQNVASYLAKALRIDWRLGAAYFESKLIDYDVCSNWLNWLYTSGVGNDKRGNDRFFNVIKQGYQYDPTGQYAKTWIPELQAVPQEYIYSPHEMNASQQEKYACRLGEDYPHPIVHIQMSPKTNKPFKK